MTETKALADYKVTTAKISELGELINPISIKSTDDYKTAKVHLKTMRDMRLDLEDFRTEKKRIITAAGKALDAEAKELQGLMDPIEQRVKSKIKEWDDIKEAARAKKAAIEQARIDGIKILIRENFYIHPEMMETSTLQELIRSYNVVKKTTVTQDEYAEFITEANDLKYTLLISIEGYIERKELAIEEARILKEQQDAVERQRLENERIAKEQADAQRKIEADAKAKQDEIDEENQRKQDEFDRQTKALEVQQAEMQAEKTRIADAKQKIIDDEAAAKAAQVAAEQQAEYEKAVQAKAEAKAKQDAIDNAEAEELAKVKREQDAADAEAQRILNLSDSEYLDEHIKTIASIGYPELANNDAASTSIRLKTVTYINELTRISESLKQSPIVVEG